jgi:hypothetical protein
MNKKTRTLVKVWSLTLTMVLSAAGLALTDQPLDGQPSAERPSLFARAQALPTQTAATSYAYPVPFIPSLGDTAITFAHIDSPAFIEIRTVGGELVKELEARDGDGQLSWDTRNSRGDLVASDVYIYTIRNGAQEKYGKLVIVR